MVPIEVVIAILAIGNISGMIAAYSIGNNAGLRSGYAEGIRVADAWKETSNKWEALAKKQLGEIGAPN